MREPKRPRPEERKPAWLKKRIPRGDGIARVERLIHENALHTVCVGAKCPNRNECYQMGTATFLVLGDVCTRGCRFCSIPGRPPAPPDRSEPERLARTAEKMGLRYVVITSVTRDDLPDGGASHFADLLDALRSRLPHVQVEILIPDFQGDAKALELVLRSGPTVLNHNIETVPALYPLVRPEASYQRSLELLAGAHAWGGIPVKSGLMLGLGEHDDEVDVVLLDLHSAGVDLVTIGQYLQPSSDCIEVQDYITPRKFNEIARRAYQIGFKGVAAGPFVRSSFRAAELAEKVGVSCSAIRSSL